MKYCLFLILSATLLLGGCEKSFESFTPYTTTGNDSVWAAANTGDFSRVEQLHQNLLRPSLTDSFNLGVASVVEFPDNIRIEIPALSFQTIAGTTTDGKGVVEMLLLKKKGDLIRFRKQTTSNGYLLESGGVLFLKVTKNGAVLSLVPGHNLRITYRDSLPNPLMRPFIGVEPSSISNLVNFNWVRNDSAVFIRTTQSPAGYELFTNTLNWINCDYFRDTAELKTRIVITMPVEFTNSNTSTWIVYKNIRSVMQLEGDPVNRIWKKERVPVNRAVIYVTVTKRGDNYWLGTQETVTAINQNITMHPVQKSLQEIKAFLDAL